MWQQQERSDFEKSLIEWERASLDRARNGIHPLYGGRMSVEDARSWINARLPEGDTGRMP